MEEALYKGNSHDNGGIKVLVDGTKPIEVEGNEYLLCNKAMQSTKIFEFKDKTNKEILDQFHAYSTCEFIQNEAHSGDFIICKKVVLDTNKRNITGTIKEIVNIMQSEKGCRQSTDDVFKTGGEVENDIKYLTTIEYEDNGKTITWGTKNNRGRETVLNKSNEDILSELEYLKEMIKVGEIDYERAKKYYESISYLGTPKNNQKVKDAFSDMNFTKRTLYVNKNILLPFFEKNLSEKETLQGGAGDKKTIKDIKPIRFEAGKRLTENEKKEVYANLKDSYKVNQRPLTEENDKIVWLGNASDYATKSDITGRLLRWYIYLPDGRIAHPTEVFGSSVTISEIDIVQKNIESNEFWAKKEYDQVFESLKKHNEIEKIVDAISIAINNGAKFKEEYDSNDIGKRHKRVRLLFANGNNLSVPEYVINTKESYLGLDKSDLVKYKIGEVRNKFLNFQLAEIDWEKFYNENLNGNEVLKGGVADKLTIEDIAKKHNVSLDYAEQQLAKGIKIESEHTNDIEKQTEIALDHLSEFIEYYNELDKMENKLKSKENIMENNNIEINSEIVNNYDQVPVVWKNTNEIKEVNFINSPYNKDLIKILEPFAGTDELRPIMSGINFDENGITATDAHKLIILPYPNKEYKGTYATMPKRNYQGAEVKKDLFTNVNYPNYVAITPLSENAHRVQKISVYKLFQYTKVALHYSNKATHQVKYSLGDTTIGLNGKFLIEILETALKLGYKKLYAYTREINKAIVFSPSENYKIGKDVIILCMPVILYSNEVDDKGNNVYYNGAEDLDFAREITAYYDFSKDEIINQDGSVAEFKMNYGEYDVLDSNEIKMLKNFAKNNTIPVLDYFRVKDDKISASDLETYLTIKNTTLKDGLYRINDNAAEYDSSMTLGNFDLFPNADEEKSETQIKFVISSEVLLHYINIAIDYTGNDEIRPVMMGILFDYKDNEMFMVATDAHKLFKLNITQYIEINKGQKDFQFILSKANLLRFLENIDESPLTISSSTSHVTFENANCKFQSRSIDGKYPNYNGVISSFKTKKLEINIKDLFICIKSKEAETFIKNNKKEDITIYNKIGKSDNVFDIYLATSEYDRGLQVSKILDKIEICKVNYKLSSGDYQTKDSLVLLMPMNLDVADNFAFNVKFFKTILESLNCENVEMFYDEKNRAYIFGGDCFAYKHTIKAQKSISKPKETPAKIETKKVEPKESTESNEIEKAIETFEMLIGLGGTKKELKEWNEAVETFKMLVGDDKMKIGGDLKIAKRGYTRIPYDLKISGIYDFKSNVGVGYELSIYGTERQNDTDDALNMLDSNITAKKELGSIIVKNNAIRRLAKGETINAISSTGIKGKLTRIKDLFKHGGDLKIVETDNWQIKNANDRYYSVSMQSGNPVWNESPDLGYSYKKEDAENIKNKLIELGNKDLQLVKYDPNWWKMELGGNTNSEIGMAIKVGVDNDNFFVKSNFGNWSIIDRKTNKMVVGYSKKEDAIITAKGLNDINNSSELNKIISKLKSMNGYGYFINKMELGGKFENGGDINDLKY